MSTYPANASLPQSASLVRRFPLDEASGDAVDIGTSTDNMTDTNTVGAGTGYTADGADFDNARDYTPGSSEYFIDTSVYTDLAITGSFTMSMLINSDTSGADQTLFSKWRDAAGGKGPYYWRLTTADKLSLIVSADGSATTGHTGDTALTVDGSTWYHVVAVFEASTRIEHYINGATDGTNTTSIPASNNDNTRNPRIGAYGDSGDAAARFFGGLQNDLIIWNTALTDAEVLELYTLYQTASTGGAGLMAAML